MINRHMSSSSYIDYLRTRTNSPCSPRTYTDEEIIEKARELGREAGRQAYEDLKKAEAKAAEQDATVEQHT